MQWCRQGEGGGLKPPQIFSSCYYVYKQLPQKDIENKRGKKKQVISSVTHAKIKA